MTAIEDFIRARLWRDECYARNAFGDHNAAGPEWHEQWSGALNIGDGGDLVMTSDSQVSRFMERFDPKRILAEVEAKRAILAEHQLYDLGLDPCCRTCGNDDGSGGLTGDWPCTTVCLLALPYAGHPDYDETWRSA